MTVTEAAGQPFYGAHTTSTGEPMQLTILDPRTGKRCTINVPDPPTIPFNERRGLEVGVCDETVQGAYAP
jgi:hypothetical protein